MTKLKAIVRHIARHEAHHNQSNRYKAESRSRLRRLANLGTLAHQPAIAAYCKVADSERETVIENLLMQKMGSNPKHMKIFKEIRKAKDEERKALQHDGDTEVWDDRKPELPDGRKGTLSEHTSEVRLAAVACGGSPSVAG